MRFDFIAKHRGTWTVSWICEALAVSRSGFHARAQAEQAIAPYIDGFYNPVRRRSALDYTSPAQFERTAAR